MDKEIRIFVKRDDLIHPDISGNKWRKLKYIIEDILSAGYKKVISFGGAYSNHLRALAAVCAHYDLALTCIIRGDEADNENLQFLKSHGAHLIFVDRTLYKNITQERAYHLLRNYYDASTHFIIPEGGNHTQAWKGCREIVHEIAIDFQYIITSVGTGATMTGLAQAINDTQAIIGIAALKGEDRMTEYIQLHTKNHFTIDFRYHFGGYARTTPELITFIQNFQHNHGIALDYVYTGKMFYGLYDKIKKGEIEDGSTIIALHTGGVANAAVE